MLPTLAETKRKPQVEISGDPVSQGSDGVCEPGHLDAMPSFRLPSARHSSLAEFLGLCCPPDDPSLHPAYIPRHSLSSRVPSFMLSQIRASTHEASNGCSSSCLIQLHLLIRVTPPWPVSTFPQHPQNPIIGWLRHSISRVMVEQYI